MSAPRLEWVTTDEWYADSVGAGSWRLLVSPSAATVEHYMRVDFTTAANPVRPTLMHPVLSLHTGAGGIRFTFLPRYKGCNAPETHCTFDSSLAALPRSSIPAYIKLLRTDIMLAFDSDYLDFDELKYFQIVRG